ncbi:CopG family ribbon-helix-helix protein [Thermogladius sp. 4427co]|uniref:CopG family ribbon-helix-helix protein n=1 Tax=Thermogladius sp. 4427co TaxID=3450718 RepID=UPI003F7A842D
MPKPMRVGVYIPEDLVGELEAIMREKGIKSFSKIVQEALRLYIAEHSWKLKDRVTGIIGLLYDHEIGHVDEELVDIQHMYLDVVVSYMHIHLDERNCMLAIAVRGSREKVRELVGNLEKTKGVKLIRLMLV